MIEIIEFTDPYCTWCWGSEPVLRKLEWVYGSNLKIDFVMGGLVKDIRSFYDPLNMMAGKTGISRLLSTGKRLLRSMACLWMQAYSLK